MTTTTHRSKSDERPGLVFLAALFGCIAGMVAFFSLAYRSWDKHGTYWDDGRNTKFSHSPVGAMPHGIWGHRYQLFGLLIHEEIHRSDHVESHGLPGGYWPWGIVFGSLGGGLAGYGVWLIMYHRKQT